MLGSVAMLGRQDVHDGHGPAGKILHRRCERAAADEQLTLSFGKTALTDASDFAPQHRALRDRAFLEGRNAGAPEVSLDLTVLHSPDHHLPLATPQARA